MAAQNSNSLLIEFLSEELPPINLERNIGQAFADAVFEQLNGFVFSDSVLKPIAAPRRFGCVITGISYEQVAQKNLRKGPAIASALKDNVPTPALLGFAKSCGVDWQALQQREDGYFYFESTSQGKNLTNVLSEIINNALKKIPIAKAMRWGNSDYQFVRPVHNLVVMFNGNVIRCESLGLTAVAQTLGHRFMVKAPVKLTVAHEYFTQLKLQGSVIAEFAARKTVIEQQLHQQAEKLGLKISFNPELLDEVSALVEWPEVLVGEFAEKFLAVPQECLILSMAKNQKYFALVNDAGKLSNKFLFVANLISKDPQVIIEGNQKVLTARLADAEFFYEFDKRTPLAQFVSKTANVVYHNKLGSQLERIERLQQIASDIAPLFAVDKSLAVNTAYLLKADLVTEMVGEFPELQGIMGAYYALSSGESQEVANAIEKHYYPRFSGDVLPDTPLATVVSLADKLESLIGIWGIGLIPSGDKDPYALRRAALGIVRILLVTDVDLKTLLDDTFSAFAGKHLASNTQEEVYQFILQRLANYLTSQGYMTKIVHAVIQSNEFNFNLSGAKKFNHLVGLLDALVTFASNESNAGLLQANKRIENILTKNGIAVDTAGDVNPALFSEAAESELYDVLQRQFKGGSLIIEYKNSQNWSGYFDALASFNLALDKFFTEVMVMAEDLAVRQNRLNLLSRLRAYFNLACKLSELA